MTRRLALSFLIVVAVVAGGCAPQATTCPRVIFLDGAGWVFGDTPVRRGLKEANYPGPVERFGWGLGLGAPLDHAAAGPDLGKTAQLAERITRLRRENPDGQIVLMGLSSGTTVIVYALEKLPADVQVDEVVLLSPSISGLTDLRPALSHLRGKMYVTLSDRDNVLAMATSSGPEPGEPAGRAGFALPLAGSGGEDPLYRKIEYIPWRTEYSRMGWSGGHTSVTSSEFIAAVIAPKLMNPSGTSPGTAPPAPEQLAASPSASAPQPEAPRDRADPRAAELLRTLGTGDDSARQKAARELKRFKLPPVVAGLTDALRRDGCEDVRKEAAISLGELSAWEAQPALRRAAREDRDSGVRKAALKSVQKIEDAVSHQP